MSWRSTLSYHTPVVLLTGIISIFSLPSMLAQTAISTGSIQGTVTDQSGAVLSGAKVLVTNKSTSQTITVTTSSSGTYASGALAPGAYMVRVEAPGFSTVEVPVNVQVNVTASANVKLQVGQATQVVEVAGSAVQINTEQATVQGVLTEELLVSRWTAWISAMKPSARPPRTFRLVRFRSPAAAIIARPLDRVDLIGFGERDHEIRDQQFARSRLLLFS